ncbi:hypothetical protein I5M27_17465 [Adhaeribacter sp. BT258]|uniref:Uncharacterized protein n=1 Tax=Adhaeribacter terrigena TaxID=2793070 RepID=A0ABS1C5Y6_9BACT|nr:hypothetical protein [Adhaeribacter terrigena]MBK0404784.1 hypothetical protein [Adhaeribacter terrigena]
MNRFGSNSFENENDQFAENQRIGRQLAENNPRPWTETFDPERTYQSRHHGHPPYRPDYPNRSNAYAGQSVNRNAYGNERPFYAGAHQDYPANDPAWRHHDDRIWTERNDYKDSDYRYRSGHRNYWHEDYDDKYEANRPFHHRHPEGIIGHVSEGIREGWNNLVHRHDRNQPDRDRDRDNRERQSGYETRHWPNAENYPGAEQRSQRVIREEERREDEMRRRQKERESHRHDDRWHNAGPNHHDEDFFDSRNFRL